MTSDAASTSHPTSAPPSARPPRSPSSRTSPQGDLGLLEPEEAPRFAHMTFPAYARFLSLGPDALEPTEPGGSLSRPVAVRAIVDGRPAGLALAAVPLAESGETSELLSLFVEAERRGQGIAVALLERIEQAVRERGASVLQTVYMTGKPGTPALEAVLARRGWSTPVRRAVTLRCTPEEAARTPWWECGRLQPGDEVFPWREAPAVELESLRRSQAATGWIPSGLEPWRYDAAGIHEPSSLGLRRGGRIVGWVLTHPIAPDSVRITCAYVERPLAARGVSFALFREAVRQMDENGVLWCTFVSYVEHPAMVRFVEERCAPYVSFFRELRYSAKVVAVGGDRERAGLPGNG